MTVRTKRGDLTCGPAREITRSTLSSPVVNNLPIAITS